MFFVRIIYHIYNNDDNDHNVHIMNVSIMMATK